LTHSNASSGSTSGFDPDRPVALHPLVYLAQDEEVTVGRPDVDAYGIVGLDSAEVIRRLESGATPREAAAWYEQAYGERIDVADFVAGLQELGFVRSPDEAPAPAAPVRWTRLGAAVFSRPAWILYAALATWALIATMTSPDLMPSYRNVFFTDYFAIIQVALFVAAVPQLMLHEGFHTLAGRRLGLRSRLTLGRRLYFIVLETSLDGLVAVPRRKRYLPILAGMLADVLVVAALTIAADLTREPGGAFSLGGKICLAMALTVWVRIAWQFFFYLRTDLYVLISTALGCVDLQTTAKRLMQNRFNRLLGRDDRIIDESNWHRADRKAARWYSWLIVVGYTVSLATFAFAAGPIAYEFFTGVVGRFTSDSQVTWEQLLDSAVVVGFLLVQMVVLAWLFIKERRREKRQLHHVIA